MKFFCVSHRPPRFHPGWDYTAVSPEKFGDRDTLVIPEDHFGPGWHGTVLSEYAQLFGLADWLADTRVTDDILLFQYRKFASIRHSGVPWTERGFGHVSSPAGATELFPNQHDLSHREGRSLVGPLLPVSSLADQYARHHFAADFARFCLTLSRLPSFDIERCASFAASRFLIPSPALGIFSVADFLRHMSILRQAWSAFNEQLYIEREGSQRRVGGFLLERLHSFLLLEDAAQGAIVLAPGYQIVVIDPAQG